jgi:cyclophilin family peptidyl-prolyl cis-trans isomerase
MSLLTPDSGLLFWMIVSFGIVFVILSKYGFPVIIKAVEQRKAYTTEGGCHHLDGNYTVYGELIEGFDVLDIIAGQPRDEYDRPKKDIRIIQLKIEN